MSDEPFIGGIALTALPYAPKGTAFCDGQAMAISQNQALFALLGITYGGDGRTSFNLPDLRGRVPVGAGNSVDTSWTPPSYDLGAVGGTESVTLTVAQMPVHAHGDVTVSGRQGTTTSPDSAYLSAGDALRFAPGADAATAIVGNAGGGQPHENRAPSIALSWIIYLTGVFPSRP